MRIRLIVDLPIEARHGAVKGRTFDVVRSPNGRIDGTDGWWFVGDAGEPCRAWGREVEVIPPNTGREC